MVTSGFTLNTYRGIKLAENVKLFKKDGSYSPKVTKGLDTLADLLEKRGHKSISDYTGDKEQLLIRFNCGHENSVTTTNYKKPHYGCSKCSGRDNGQAEEDLRRLVEENGHRLLTKYVNNNTRVLIDYNCGHVAHLIKPSHYKDEVGCPKCKGQCPIQAENDFRERLKENGDELLGEYKNAKTKVLINYNCDHKPHLNTPNSYKSGIRCPKCARDRINLASQERSRRAAEKFVAQVKENGDLLLSGYINTDTKILIKFNCNHDAHWISPDNYKGRKGCPKCSESKGEKIIRKWLEKQDIVHMTQYTFPSLSNRKYDFCLPFDNLIVEVHGEQHYKEVEYFKKLTLDKVQENDRIKREFAENLGYKYIEVDYKESKPKLALERFIEAYSKLKSELTTVI